MDIDTLAGLITQRYGVVRRARGSFLYTASGTRLLDMYLEGGRAILGWRAGSCGSVFKNVLSRGVLGSYDTGHYAQMERAVCSLLGDNKAKTRRVIAFTDKMAAMRTAITLSPDGTMFWRPWGGKGSEGQGNADAPCIVLVPPFPWGEPLYLLAAKVNLAGVNDVNSTRIPAPLAAAISRSVYDLKAALKVRGEKDWSAHDKVLTRLWERHGPYLYPKADAVDNEGAQHDGQYDAFVAACLDCGIVISPDCNVPSIVSPDIDKGVFKKLSSLSNY